jgi:predicted regulator of Ras-like GTPase activity (Roadblock/LC7/MglB family)
MADKNLKVRKILEKLSDIRGKAGIMVLDNGDIISTPDFDPDLNVRNIAKNIKKSVLNLNRIVNNPDFDSMDQILIESSQRKIIISQTKKKACSLILIGQNIMNTGLAQIKIKEILPELEKVLS